MALIVSNCPHCFTQSSAMVLFGVRFLPVERGEQVEGTGANGLPKFQWDCVVSAICQVCFLPLSALLHSPYKNTKSEYKNSVAQASSVLMGEGNVVTLGFKLKDFWPKPEPPNIPAHLPESVAKAFRAAENNYQMVDGEDAAAMLYRRAIDVAIREKHPEIGGLLAKRITALTDQGLLPPSMKAWADQIRLIGNEGAHEPEGVTKEDLTPMRGFTEAFLRYFITIPFEVDLRRGLIDAQGNNLSPAV